MSTENTQHTPTPWFAVDNGTYIEINIEDSPYANTIGELCASKIKWGQDVMKANADFIVTACNSHASLVARVAELEGALKGLVDDEWRMSADWGPSSERIPIMASARAALGGDK